MSKVKDLTQKDINQNIATVKDFWEYSKTGVRAPFSFWKNSAPNTVFEIINWFGGSDVPQAYFNIIFKSLPLLKGEFPCVYANETGVIITNYRYIYNGQDGLVVIPFARIKSIQEEVNKDGDLFDRGVNKLFGEDKEMVVNYERNGSSMRLVNPALLDSLKAVYSSNEYSNLNGTQNLILENTYYDFEKFNTALKLPKITWESSFEYASEIQPEVSQHENIQVENSKTISQDENVENLSIMRKIKDSLALIVSWSLSLVFPIVGIYAYPGLNRPEETLNFWQIQFGVTGNSSWKFAIAQDNAGNISLLIFGILLFLICVFIRKTNQSFFARLPIFLYMSLIFLLWMVYMNSNTYFLSIWFYLHALIMLYVSTHCLIKPHFLLKIFNKMR